MKGRGALSILSNCRVAIVLWDVKTRNREKYLKRTRKCTFQVVLPGDKYTLRRLVRAPHHNGSRCFRSRQYGYGGGEYPGRSGIVPCDLGAPPAAAAITTPASPAAFGGS